MSLFISSLFLLVDFSLSRPSQHLSSPHFAKDVRSSSRLRANQPSNSTKKNGPHCSIILKKNSRDSLFGPTQVTCPSLNQSLWPREWNALIGQAQATRSSPWEPGNEVKPTQVWRTENGREEVVSPQKNQSIVARKMRECVQAKRKSQLPTLSYRSSLCVAGLALTLALFKLQVPRLQYTGGASCPYCPHLRDPISQGTRNLSKL